MKIDLALEVANHLNRVRNLALEAETDVEQSFGNRASAMSALTRILSELTKSQESIVTMKRLQKTEQVVIETVKDFLSDEQLGHLIEALDRNLTQIQ